MCSSFQWSPCVALQVNKDTCIFSPSCLMPSPEDWTRSFQTPKKLPHGRCSHGILELCKSDENNLQVTQGRNWSNWKNLWAVLGSRPKGSRRFMNPDYSFPGSGTHQPFTHRIQRLDMASGWCLGPWKSPFKEMTIHPTWESIRQPSGRGSLSPPARERLYVNAKEAFHLSGLTSTWGA